MKQLHFALIVLLLLGFAAAEDLSLQNGLVLFKQGQYEKALGEFRKRDDSWLMSVDKDWPWGPTNNYCKWFHVCEHESNHNGQIKLLAKRLPGAKPDSE